jgi:hypothetical protein
MSSFEFEDRPPPDPEKLLSLWMEWEKGDTPPGRVMSNLKTAGMREYLESAIQTMREIAGG